MYVQRSQLITTVFGCTLFFWFTHCTMRRLFLVAAHFTVLILYFFFIFFISIFIQDDFNAFPLRISINRRFSTIHHTFAIFPHGHAWSEKVNEGQKMFVRIAYPTCSYWLYTLQFIVLRHVYYRMKRIGANSMLGHCDATNVECIEQAYPRSTWMLQML